MLISAQTKSKNDNPRPNATTEEITANSLLSLEAPPGESPLDFRVLEGVAPTKGFSVCWVALPPPPPPFNVTTLVTPPFQVFCGALVVAADEAVVDAGTDVVFPPPNTDPKPPVTLTEDSPFVVLAEAEGESVLAAPAPEIMPVYVWLYDDSNARTLDGIGAMVTPALEHPSVFAFPANDMSNL